MGSSGPRGGEGLGVQWKKISSATVTEDSGRGDDNDPNDDDGCPMGTGGPGIWRSGSGSSRLTLVG